MSWSEAGASIEPGDDQHSTIAGERPGGGKLRAIGMSAAHRFREHPLAAVSIKSLLNREGGLTRVTALTGWWSGWSGWTW
jgi:hypothetical protein